MRAARSTISTGSSAATPPRATRSSRAARAARERAARRPRRATPTSGERREAPGAARVAQRVIVRVDDAGTQRDARAGQRDDACGPHDQPRGRPGRRVAVDEQPVGDRTFDAVRRLVQHARFGIAEHARDERRRAAAVEQHRVGRAERAQQRDELGAVDADRRRGMTPVDRRRARAFRRPARGSGGGRDAAVALGVVRRGRIVDRRARRAAAPARRRAPRRRRRAADRYRTASVTRSPTSGIGSERLRRGTVGEPQPAVARPRRRGCVTEATR